ncbi:hypothetical protein BHM03_00051660 [Ensete ventricosum]|nr:hypothetical protein BHM03_00051660 [Ensete ventricosum]
MKNHDGHKHYAVTNKVEFRSIFNAPSQKFKILAIPDVLAHGKPYEHSFAEKHDGHKLCAKSRAVVEFRSIFRAPSRKFKILAIPDVLAHGKSYEHGFVKKRNGHKLCVKSCAVKFRSVFRAPSRKFKILVIPVLLAHGKLYEHDIAKKCDGHKFCVMSRAESSFDRFSSRVSIDFTCIVSKIQNTVHSRRISP